MCCVYLRTRENSSTMLGSLYPDLSISLTVQVNCDASKISYSIRIQMLHVAASSISHDYELARLEEIALTKWNGCVRRSYTARDRTITASKWKRHGRSRIHHITFFNICTQIKRNVCVLLLLRSLGSFWTLR